MTKGAKAEKYEYVFGGDRSEEPPILAVFITGCCAGAPQAVSAAFQFSGKEKQGAHASHPIVTGYAPVTIHWE